MGILIERKNNRNESLLSFYKESMYLNDISSFWLIYKDMMNG